MSKIKCPGCGADMDATASICTKCRKTLEVALANIAVYWPDLETLRAGQVRYGSGGGSARSSGESHLGMDTRFDRGGYGTEIQALARNTITTWTRYVLDHVSIGHGPVCVGACLHVSCSLIRRSRPPADTIVSCCRYLLGWADWLRVSPGGVDALRDLRAVERKLASLIDRPADRWYAGVCGSVTDTAAGEVVCERELYAEAEAAWVRCHDCGCTYDVPARRKALLGQARTHIARADVLARAIAMFGEDVDDQKLAARILEWVRQRRLFSRGSEIHMGKKRSMYVLGEVLDLMAEDAARGSRRRRRAR